jgi:flagellar basal-body rod modification protein FlgD
MPIEPTSTSSGAAALNLTDPKKSAGFMGKEDFLKLLVAQLKNQDPSNAQDMEGMTQQMTQFSIVEQLTNLNEASQESSALDMLGKTVAYRTRLGEVKEGVVGHVDVSGSAPKLTVGGVIGVALADVTSVKNA